METTPTTAQGDAELRALAMEIEAARRGTALKKHRTLAGVFTIVVAVLLVMMASVGLLFMAYFTRLHPGGHSGVPFVAVGGALMGAGFAAKSADHRRAALAVLGAAVIRVFAVDTRGLSDAAKTVAFLALGLSLVAVAWLYSRFGRRLRDWL